MKHNYLSLFEGYLQKSALLFYRRVKLMMSKSNSQSPTEDFFSYSSNSNFSNSLITVNFYFHNLLWINFPGIGKKYHNGQMILNADKIIEPYTVTVKTISGKQVFIIEKGNADLFFDSSGIVIKDFNSFNNSLNKKPAPKRISFCVNNKPQFKRHNAPIIFNKIGNIKFKNFDKNYYL